MDEDTLSPGSSDSSHSSDTQVRTLHLQLLTGVSHKAFRGSSLVCLCVCVCVQVQALLQEVQQLREELRGRDRTIAQLSRQLVSVHVSVARSHRPAVRNQRALIKFPSEQTVPTVTTRCRCQETTGRMDRQTQTSATERESVASQTPWREHAVSAHTLTHSSLNSPRCAIDCPLLVETRVLQLDFADVWRELSVIVEAPELAVAILD